ncbi:hypothetical protein ASC87_19050 [Rhizobacter sp. Root1221]|nr:hypothetical protein ASC87_19050 [Rhizobacter sp. Root1221]
MSTFVALAFVVALAWASMASLKRMQQDRGSRLGTRDDSELRFVRALPVGTWTGPPTTSDTA